jgi:GR25 family glycosyltransferase involved in LPS biosynthesis
MGIKLDVWAPYDGRTTAPLPGELGVWVSTINTWRYMIDNSIDCMLVLEDDVQLSDNFVDSLTLCLQDLPGNFECLSLYYFEGQNWTEDRTDVGSEYIHKSLNQYSAAQGTIYSNRGAKNLTKLVKKFGIQYTADCFILSKFVAVY